MSATVVLRKYENRRLYDTESRRYVNLEDVARLVREGREVRVEDVRSGEDVTALVLTQVVLEESRLPGHALPVAILRQMIVAGARARELARAFWGPAWPGPAPDAAAFLSSFGGFAPSEPRAPEAPSEVEELRRTVARLTERLDALDAGRASAKGRSSRPAARGKTAPSARAAASRKKL